MASSSSNSILTTANQTFTFTNPIKLDGTNYLMWKTQVLASIRGNSLESFIDGSSQAPQKYVTPGVVSPVYIAWMKTDQLMLSWLLSSMTESVLSLVIGLSNSFEVWQVLGKKKSATVSQIKVLQLRIQLVMTKKEGMSISEYYLKMKGLADSLAAAGEPISNKEFSMYLLGGIGKEYNHVAVMITSKGSETDPNDLLAHLMAYESRLEQQSEIAVTDLNNQVAAAANFVQKGQNKKKFYNGSQGNKET